MLSAPDLERHSQRSRMGNLISCRLGHLPSNDVLKIVHCSGFVNQICIPVKVKDLLKEYPHCFICCSTDLNFVRPPSKLPDDAELQLGNIYFLLPLSIFYSVPSRSDIRALIAKAAAARKTAAKRVKKSALSPSPKAFEIKHIGSQLTTDGLVSSKASAYNTPELRAAYKNHIIAKNCKSAWRPSLKTIDESSLKLNW